MAAMTPTTGSCISGASKYFLEALDQAAAGTTWWPKYDLPRYPGQPKGRGDSGTEYRLQVSRLAALRNLATPEATTACLRPETVSILICIETVSIMSLILRTSHGELPEEQESASHRLQTEQARGHAECSCSRGTIPSAHYRFGAKCNTKIAQTGGG